MKNNSNKMKYGLSVVAFFFGCTAAFGQLLLPKPIYSLVEQRVLYVVDSIPVTHIDYDYSLPTKKEIDHINKVKKKDSINVPSLRRVAYNSIIYIFTKKYANRPDSIKKIPSSKQMEVVDGVWNLRGIPYSGKYIDYYDNGQKQSEGVFFNGKLAYGEYHFVYYKNGKLADKEINFSKDDQSNYSYSDSIFYLNGSLYRTGLISKQINGKSFIIEKKYFLNGQLSVYSFSTRDLASNSAYIDTVRRFNSYGKLIESIINDTASEKYKNMMERIKIDNDKLSRGEHVEIDKQKSDSDIISMNLGLSNSDSTNASAYLEIGKAELRQLKYDSAIFYFDKALHFEPFFLEASANRAYARIKRDELAIYTIGVKANAHENTDDYLFGSRSKKLPSFLKSKSEISDKEREFICADLQRAEQYPEIFSLQGNDFYSFITRSLLLYCSIKSDKFPVYGYKLYW